MRLSKHLFFTFAIALFLALTRFGGAQEEPSPTQTPLSPVEKWRLHWEERVARFKEENLEIGKLASAGKFKEGTVVFVGDSLTERFDLEAHFPGRRVLNRGIVSDHIGLGDQGVLRRLDSSVYDCSPTLVVLWIGVNDLGDLARSSSDPATSRTALLEGYEQILFRINQYNPYVKILCLSLIPTRGRYAHLNPQIELFNQGIQAIAEKNHCEYLDIHTLTADESGQLREDLTRDGLHLTEAGYQAIAPGIRAALGWE